MKAIVVQNPGPQSNLKMLELPDPLCKAGEALIRVRATSVNRADLLQRAGRYPPPQGASEILGLDVAGEVQATSGAQSPWNVGDKVCAVISGGGYASIAAVPERLLMPIPKNWRFEQAAAMPEVYLTAYLNLVVEGCLAAGQKVLVHGGASGVGTAAIQIAKQFGAEVYVTVGSDEKVARCLALGATHAINYKTFDFVDEVRKRTEGRGVSLILDCVGAGYLKRNIDLLSPRGRLVMISVLSGAEAAIDLRPILAKRLTIQGSVLRSRSLDERASLRDSFMRDIWPHFESGAFGPVIDCVLPLEDAEKAHSRMSAGEHVGKIVLRVGEERA